MRRLYLFPVSGGERGGACTASACSVLNVSEDLVPGLVSLGGFLAVEVQ